jgi:hypothetical protein
MFRSKQLFEVTVICDKCGAEKKEQVPVLNFDTEMSAALGNGYSFEDDGSGTFKNICWECRRG